VDLLNFHKRGSFKLYYDYNDMQLTFPKNNHDKLIKLYTKYIDSNWSRENYDFQYKNMRTVLDFVDYEIQPNIFGSLLNTPNDNLSQHIIQLLKLKYLTDKHNYNYWVDPIPF
jgi:hypothetical protein